MEPAELLTQFGLMNSISNIRTGNWIIDMCLCFLLPLLMTKLKPLLVAWWEKWRKRNRRLELERVSRCINFQRSNHWYHNSQNSNDVLQEAVLLYLGSLQHLTQNYKVADVELKWIEQSLGEDDDSTSDDEDECNPARWLEQCRRNTLPHEDTEVEIEEGLYLKRTNIVDTDDAKTSKGVISNIQISCDDTDASNAAERIEKFLESAFAYYKHIKSQNYKPKRYLYTPLHHHAPSADSGSKEDCSMMYRRYELSDEKTFDSFFHPQKDALLRLVDNFLQKKGKFALQGYPHKLGLLLYGPPGTGKTSFIKALAHHSNRHIVSIPLSKINTNQELMDIMFDQKCRVDDDSLPNRVPFSKCIYVMEDVDAASDVVHRRDAAMPVAAPQTTSRASSPTDFTVVDSAGGHSSSGEGDGNDDDSVNQRRQARSTSHTHRKAKSGRADAATDLGAQAMIAKSIWQSSDRLTLAGILNVLDGVVDSPGRIVVMTTNHPEKLDPALIRPGRINKKLELGYLAVDSAAHMVAHYFQEEATPKLMQRFRAAFPVGSNVTPADLESKCAEYDSLVDMVEMFEGLKAAC